ncbi:hypothetical protein FS749_000184 [Ceratobasidium sp. UAMH 11750]|nr:hypothetical protein FS749_000184 [Ceratobasidium sp. UAMH 11750]
MPHTSQLKRKRAAVKPSRPTGESGRSAKSKATKAAVAAEEIPIKRQYTTGISFTLATGAVKPMLGSRVRWYDEWRSRGLRADDGVSPEIHYLAVNSYAFTFGSEFHMVVPVDLEGTGIEVVGWATSLHTGVRRAHRAVSGYHPTPAVRMGQGPDVWRMESVFVREKVKLLMMTTLDVWG